MATPEDREYTEIVDYLTEVTMEASDHVAMLAIEIGMPLAVRDAVELAWDRVKPEVKQLVPKEVFLRFASRPTSEFFEGLSEQIKNGPETPAKKSLRTVTEKPIEKDSVMEQPIPPAPFGYSPMLDEVDGSVVTYSGPTETVHNIKILRNWNPREGYSFYIDNDDAYYGADDLVVLRSVIDRLIEEAGDNK